MILWVSIINDIMFLILFLGECEFFSGNPRKVSARSKNFTEVITLFKIDFLQ